MTGERDRIDRAHSYVRGLMDEAEREQAERDLADDASFREAVMEVASKMRSLGAGQEQTADGTWSEVAEHLARLPHMKAGKPHEPPRPFGRRRSDRFLEPSEGQSRTVRQPERKPPMTWRRALMIAAAIAAAFAVGYLFGRA